MTDEATNFEQESAGTQVGRYRLAYEIAAGGQASIFMAVADGPSGFGKVVALKRLHKHLAKESSNVSMFLDEARLASQLTHPNVCGVIDFGVEDGEYFMAMEFLTGVTVSKLASHAQRLAAQNKLDRKLWVSLVGFVIGSAAEGLRAAHELKDARGEKLNVVHRDVSPQNLMVGFDGSVRVMDFGIAKYDERETETALGEVKGKYAYMSPEQARATPIDARTDIWALGVIAWELLTLRRLFKRDSTANTVLAVVSAPIEPPSMIDPSIPPELDAIVLAALERDLQVRTSDARVLGAALRKASGNADASDLAAWVHDAFPAAEVEARTMIDLARQSARGVPSIARRESETSNSSIDAPIHPPAARGAPDPSPVATGGSRMVRVAAAVALALGALAAAAAVGVASISAPVTAPPPSAAVRNDDVRPPPVEPPAPSATPVVEPIPGPAPTPEEVPSAGTSTPPEAQALADDPPAPRPRPARPERPLPVVEAPSSPPPTTAPEPATAPTPPTAVQATTNGTLVVVTPGSWANVYGPDGDLWGATPLRRSLPPGDLTVELRFEGQPPGRRVSVAVPSGGLARISERP